MIKVLFKSVNKTLFEYCFTVYRGGKLYQLTLSYDCHDDAMQLKLALCGGNPLVTGGFLL